MVTGRVRTSARTSRVANAFVRLEHRKPLHWSSFKEATTDLGHLDDGCFAEPAIADTGCSAQPATAEIQAVLPNLLLQRYRLFCRTCYSRDTGCFAQHLQVVPLDLRLTREDRDPQAVLHQNSIAHPPSPDSYTILTGSTQPTQTPLSLSSVLPTIFTQETGKTRHEQLFAHSSHKQADAQFICSLTHKPSPPMDPRRQWIQDSGLRGGGKRCGGFDSQAGPKLGHERYKMLRLPPETKVFLLGGMPPSPTLLLGHKYFCFGGHRARPQPLLGSAGDLPSQEPCLTRLDNAA